MLTNRPFYAGVGVSQSPFVYLWREDLFRKRTLIELKQNNLEKNKYFK